MVTLADFLHCLIKAAADTLSLNNFISVLPLILFCFDRLQFPRPAPSESTGQRQESLHEEPAHQNVLPTLYSTPLSGNATRDPTGALGHLANEIGK